MTERSFVDTNVLVYAAARSAGAKQRVAAELLDSGILSGKIVFSIQVFQEYFSACVKKLQVDPAIARRTIELYGQQSVVLPDVDDVLQAIDLHRLHQLSVWDALIVRAAIRGQCKVLYTEDLQHRQVFQGLRVVNPFI